MRILVVRLGAYGDMVIISPLIRHLKSQGHSIYLMTSDRGMEVMKGNPHITELIYHEKDSVPIEKLGDKIKDLAKKHKCERTIDLSESIEVALSLHPRSPHYSIPKYERRKLFERNFYEYTFEFANEPWDGVSLRPELFFTDDEVRESKSYLGNGFNLLIGMSGSNTNKTWPWNEDLVKAIKQDYGDKVHVITVGEEKCQLIEPQGEGITNLSGKIPMRISMCLTSLVDCVISPDTGLLHAAGCYDTPKIGLLGHNTREVITKHFTNDYSVEADEEKAECAPCFKLIYDMKIQCPRDESTMGAMCMSSGIEMGLVYERFKEVYAKSQR